MQVCFLLLLLMHLHVTDGCPLAGNTEVKLVTSYTLGSVTLPCSCTGLQSKPETVTWMKYTNQWVRIYPESEQYKDRVRLVNDLSPGNLSLLISHLTAEDNGDYSCSVNGEEIGYVRLTVKGCTLKQPTERSVTGTVGHSVLLSCSCYELQAKPQTFTWMFDTGSKYVEIFPKDPTDRYSGRVRLVNDRSPGNLSLLISHLSLQDGGWYRCKISNHPSTDIHLTVKEPFSTSTTKIIKTTSKAGLTTNKHSRMANEETSGTSGNETPTVVIISSSVAGVLLLLLILILGALMYWKYKGQRQGQRENGDGQTGQRTQQSAQAFSKPLNLSVTSETAEAVHKQNDSDVLYAVINHQTKCNKAEEKNDSDVLYSVINSQTKCNKAEEKDEVTYSTVVHSNTVRAAHTPVTSGDTTV